MQTSYLQKGQVRKYGRQKDAKAIKYNAINKYPKAGLSTPLQAATLRESYIPNKVTPFSQNLEVMSRSENTTL